MPDAIQAPKKHIRFSLLPVLFALSSVSYAVTPVSPTTTTAANNTSVSSTALPNAYELVKKMDAQKREMARLAGEIESLQQQINSLKQELRLEIKQELATEFERTLQDKVQAEVNLILGQSGQMQKTIQPADVSASTQGWGTEVNPLDNNSSTGSDPEVSEQKQIELAYAAAYSALKNEGVDAGIEQMKAFIESYPDHDLVANAHYWLGEFYLKDTPPNVNSAKEQFLQVITDYKNDPNNDKQSKALYRLASFAKISGDSTKAKQFIKILVTDYADSSEAKLAQSVKW